MSAATVEMARPVRLLRHSGLRRAIAALLCLALFAWLRSVGLRFEETQRLIYSVETGDVASARLALLHGANPNARPTADGTPRTWADFLTGWLKHPSKYDLGPPLLDLAARTGQLDLVRLLVRAGSGIGARDISGYTPLMTAVAWQQDRAAALLVQLGSPADASTRAGQSALNLAAHKGDSTLIPLLLSHGARIVGPGNGALPTLLLAAASGRPDAVRVLVDHGASLNIEDSAGESPLLIAAAANRRLVAYLLQHGCNARQADHTGRTPLLALFEAAAERPPHGALIPLLIGAPARASVGNATTVAVSGPRATAAPPDLRVAQELILAGADVNAADRFGNTPLSVAAALPNPSACRFLLDRGAQPDPARSVRVEERSRLVGKPTRQSREQASSRTAARLAPKLSSSARVSPLINAAAAGSVPELKLLIACGAHPDLRGSEGDLALSDAASQGELSAVRYLLTLGARPAGSAWSSAILARVNSASLPASAPNQGATALSIVRLFLRFGASADVTTPGDVPLVDAARSADLPLARLLLTYRANPNSWDMYGASPLSAIGANLVAPLSAADRARARQMRALLIHAGAWRMGRPKAKAPAQGSAAGSPASSAGGL